MQGLCYYESVLLCYKSNFVIEKNDSLGCCPLPLTSWFRELKSWFHSLKMLDLIFCTGNVFPMGAAFSESISTKQFFIHSFVPSFIQFPSQNVYHFCSLVYRALWGNQGIAFCLKQIFSGHLPRKANVHIIYLINSTVLWGRYHNHLPQFYSWRNLLSSWN